MSEEDKNNKESSIERISKKLTANGWQRGDTKTGKAIVFEIDPKSNPEFVSFSETTFDKKSK